MPSAVPVMRPKLPASSSILPYLSELDTNRIYSNFGPLAIRLEQRLAAHFGAGDHAVTTVANGTLGLALALTAQQVAPETLCVIPAWTFVASPQAARLAVFPAPARLPDQACGAGWGTFRIAVSLIPLGVYFTC